MDNFEKAMKFISKWEWSDRLDGGYTNDPVDPGGETKFGISKRANPDLDIKNLTLEQAYERYHVRYWDANSLGAVPWPYSLACFDTYIQHLPSVAKRIIEKSNGDVRTLCEERRIFYLQLIKKNPAMQKYKRGWFNRIADLAKFCDIESREI